MDVSKVKKKHRNRNTTKIVKLQYLWYLIKTFFKRQAHLYTQSLCHQVTNSAENRSMVIEIYTFAALEH